VVDDRILVVYVWRDAAEEASDPDVDEDPDPVVAFVDVELVAAFVDVGLVAAFVDVELVVAFVDVVPVVTFALVSTHKI
jgi:hypothetical protein